MCSDRINVSKDAYLAVIQWYQAKGNEMYTRVHTTSDCVNAYDSVTNAVIARMFWGYGGESYQLDAQTYAEYITEGRR